MISGRRDRAEPPKGGARRSSGFARVWVSSTRGQVGISAASLKIRAGLLAVASQFLDELLIVIFAMLQSD